MQHHNGTGGNRPVSRTDVGALWDVAVIGAGPAGAICARYLALAGHKVLLADKERFPRHKPCGDLLIPDALQVLYRQGLLTEVEKHALELKDLMVYSPSAVSFGVPSRYLTLSRKRLDCVLADAAVTAGANFVLGWVTAVQQKNDVIRIKIDVVEISSKYVVIATGANVDLPGELGLVAQANPSAIAIRRYVKSGEQLSEIVLSYDRTLLPGYAWIIPLPDNWYNIGCGVILNKNDQSHDSLKKMLKRFCESFEPVARIIRAAESTSPLNGAALRTGLASLRTCVTGRIVCVGETAGTTFPFTGEGIGKAMHTAEIAADLIDKSLRQDDPSLLGQYDDILERKIKPLYRGYLLAERWLARPWLNNYVARRIRASRFLQQRVVEFMNETGDPSRLYSPVSILQSYWK